jgi:hypothetical protein
MADTKKRVPARPRIYARRHAINTEKEMLAAGQEYERSFVESIQRIEAIIATLRREQPEIEKLRTETRAILNELQVV